MTSKLEEMWTTCLNHNTEMKWERWSGNALEYFEEQPEGVSENDLTFLFEKCRTNFKSSVYAIRTIASIAEDKLAPFEKIRDLLLELLKSPYPRIRNVACESFWQIGNSSPSISNHIKEAIHEETNSEVKKTLEHVFKLFYHDQWIKHLIDLPKKYNNVRILWYKLPICQIPPTTAEETEEGFLLVWDKGVHHLDIEFFNDNTTIEWFYSLRQSDFFEGDEFNNDESIPEVLLGYFDLIK